MSSNVEFNTLLVPVDFSENSHLAFSQALSITAGDSPVIILLHVLDPSLLDFAESHGLGSRDEISAGMREHAESEMQQYIDACPSEIQLDVIISEGLPFLEILQKAHDFAVDAIVMGKVGRRGTVERLLFGSTAEKVLRGSTKPVLILPAPT